MTVSATAAEANVRYQQILGWEVRDITSEAPANYGELAEIIADIQRALGITVDGICGPKTYWLVLHSNSAAYGQALRAPREPDELPRVHNENRLIIAGKIAVTEARLLWLQDITDLPEKTSKDYARCAALIDSLIRTKAGIDWFWEDPYDHNGDYEWCGTLPAKGWGDAGLKLQLRRDFFSSNYRLDRYARYKPINDNPVPPKPNATGPHRMIIELDRNSTPDQAVFPDGSKPRKGDIALIGGEKTGYGKHITMFEHDYDPSSPWIHTIEGNGTGLGPKGESQHGIIRAQRRIGRGPGMTDTTYIVRRILRPGIDDLELA